MVWFGMYSDRLDVVLWVPLKTKTDVSFFGHHFVHLILCIEGPNYANLSLVSEHWPFLSHQILDSWSAPVTPEAFICHPKER